MKINSNYDGVALNVQVMAPVGEASDIILTPDALRFVGYLCHRFDSRRRSLLEKRTTRAMEFDAGMKPKFCATQQHPIGFDTNWKCASIPKALQDRRVEITGPVDRKMVINGLNSGACVYMADFEDSTSPTWNNVIDGQMNLKDATNKTIKYINPISGKIYQLNETTSTLFVRPRGWHLDEAHVMVNGKVASGSIFDFALYLFHNHSALIKQGLGPYYYIPKLESHQEARLWNDVFIAAQDYLGLPHGTIRATVLIETITAAYEMEEILYELREHSLGLNCGRWDYLFSFIKKFKHQTNMIAPDRVHLTMKIPLMQAYVKRLIMICHKRGTFAMGGMSAAIPIKNDPIKNQKAMEQVAQDKLREVLAGHDGTWVAHPALVSVARKVFDQYMPTPNQIHKDSTIACTNDVTENDLLMLPRDIPYGKAITSTGLSMGVAIVLGYTEAWLRGVGCIPLNNAMEDAATAEISRVQIWQWRVHGIKTQDDDQIVSTERIRQLIQQHVQTKLNDGNNMGGKWLLAGKLVESMLNKEHLDDFLTTICYPHILVTHETSNMGQSNASKL